MGKPKYIETPDRLWELFCQYVKHERDNPMRKVEYVGRNGDKMLTPLETPITFEGFECYLSDNDYIHGLNDYRANTDGRYSEYANIITRIQSNCFVHNFKGAAVGLFNPNLIARKLGIAENTNSTVNIEQPIFKGIELPKDDSAS